MWQVSGRREMHVRICLGNLERRRPLGRPTRRLEDNIDTDLHFDLFGWEQGHSAGCCERGIESSGSAECLEFLDWLLIRIVLHGVGGYVPSCRVKLPSPTRHGVAPHHKLHYRKLRSFPFHKFLPLWKCVWRHRDMADFSSACTWHTSICLYRCWMVVLVRHAVLSDLQGNTFYLHL